MEARASVWDRVKMASPSMLGKLWGNFLHVGKIKTKRE